MNEMKKKKKALKNEEEKRKKKNIKKIRVEGKVRAKEKE